jgi:hypothetical protein
MKKIFSILGLVLMFACCNIMFTSCSKDDGMTDEETLKNMVGTWVCKELESPSAGHQLTYSQFTFYPNGKFVSTVKDIVVDPEATDTDKDGVFMKHEGTFAISHDKVKLHYENEYEPGKYGDYEWHGGIVDIREYTFELLTENGNDILRMYTTDKTTGKFKENFYYKISE